MKTYAITFLIGLGSAAAFTLLVNKVPAVKSALGG